MTNKDKVLALINTFATGDTDVAKNLLAEGYIQHNTGIADESTWQNQNGKFTCDKSSVFKGLRRI